MRKLCFLLTALLLAAPALAAVNISCQQVGTTTEVEISYDSTGSLPRAFALDVTVDTGTITAISDVSSDFWVYPGTIQISDGAIADEGEPVAPSDDPCALGGLGTSGITLEMGSLYSADDPEHTTAPASSGKLLSITVSAVPCTLTISGNGARGNVVLEDTAAADTNLPVVCELEDEPECYEGRPDYAEWAAAGKPTCWCYPRQCHGDADGLKQGSAIAGYAYVSTNDLGVLVAGWNIKDPPKGSGILNIMVGSVQAACADFDHLRQGSAIAGYARVSTNDLGRLIQYWNVKEPPKGSGTPADCLPGNRTP